MNRLWIKLTLAFLAVALIAVGVVALLSARSTGVEFRQYVVHSNMMMTASATVQRLDGYFAAQDSWDGVETLLVELNASSNIGVGRGRRAGGARLMVADASGRVVADAAGELTGERLSADVLALGVPLSVDGHQVGTLLNLTPTDVVLDAPGQAFLQSVRESLVWAGLLAAGLALILGLAISRRMTAPLRRLTEAAGAIADGDLAQQVPANGGDEIGELAAAFNQMATSLGQAETSRRNMMADVAHELRTPLTVIQGNLQAMLDGIFPLDQAQVASLYDETRLLIRLVEDLRDLAQVEAGQLRLERAPVDLATLARSAMTTFGPIADEAGVSLSLDAVQEVPKVLGDGDRLAQVLRNLLSNALRHTPAGGRVTVRVAAAGPQVVLEVSDTGSGIAAEDLPHVFDRFYRADKSRSRRGGGAGLGLAIARQLVLAHGGEIKVTSEPGQGTTFTVLLPAA